MEISLGRTADLVRHGMVELELASPLEKAVLGSILTEIGEELPHLTLKFPRILGKKPAQDENGKPVLHVHMNFSFPQGSTEQASRQEIWDLLQAKLAESHAQFAVALVSSDELHHFFDKPPFRIIR